jgi:hypothetical protein
MLEVPSGTIGDDEVVPPLLGRASMRQAGSSGPTTMTRYLVVRLSQGDGGALRALNGSVCEFALTH